MGYYLGTSSRWNMRGLHPELKDVIHAAIRITDIDFSVRQGVRTLAEQRELVAKGASKTLDSRHLYGLAVDVAPYVGGRVRWDWPLFYQLMPAFHEAAEAEGVRLRWGGVWDRGFDVLDRSDLHAEVESYVDRKRAANIERGLSPRHARKVFIDGPHLEIPKWIIANPMKIGAWDKRSKPHPISSQAVT